MKNIAIKLAKILGEVNRLPKSGFNKFQNYKYATESDALDYIRPLLSNYGIAVIFNVEEVLRLDNCRVQVKVRFTLVDGESGEMIESVVYGEARDADSKGNPQDKGIYKAITGATKYWLFKSFLISTGDDPETDRGNEPETHTTKGRSKPVESLPFTNPEEAVTWASKLLGKSSEECKKLLEDTPPDASGRKSPNFAKQVKELAEQTKELAGVN